MSASGVPRAQRHLFAALDLGKDKLYGHIKPRKNRTRSLEFCRYLRSLCPPEIRIAIVLDNFSLHYFTLDGTDHASHKEQASMIRRYIIRRNKHTADIRLHTIVTRVNVA